MRRFFLITLFAVFWMDPLYCAANLKQVYLLALDEDPQIKAAFANMKAERTALPQAIAQMLPNLSASYMNSGYESTVPFVHGYNTQTYGITLTQPIFHPQMWAQVEQGRHINKRAFATYISVVQELIIQVATQYFKVLRAIDNYEFSVQSRKGFGRELEQTQQRFNVGLIAITDVQEAKAKYDNAVALEISTKNAIADEYEKLQQITKYSVEPIVPFQASKPLPLLPPCPNSPDAWVNMSQVNNYTIIAAKENADERKANIGNQASGHFPTVDVSGSLQRYKNTPPVGQLYDSNNVTLNINIPIFAGGGVLFRTAEARYRYDQAMQELEATRRAVLSNTRQSFRGVTTAISSVKALAQAVVSNESALEATQAAYEVGTRTVVDVLNAQTDLLLVQRDHAGARYDYLLDGLLLKQASGCLTADDLYAVNDILIGKSSVAKLPKDQVDVTKAPLVTLDTGSPPAIP